MNEDVLYLAILIAKLAHVMRVNNIANYYNKYEEMDITNLTVNETLLIIDDAQTFGFEFIVKDGKILYTEQTF